MPNKSLYEIVSEAQTRLFATASAYERHIKAGGGTVESYDNFIMDSATDSAIELGKVLKFLYHCSGYIFFGDDKDELGSHSDGTLVEDRLTDNVD